MELQQLIQHMKRDVDLVRGQNDLLKRENARVIGDVRRLQNELDLTRQSLSDVSARLMFALERLLTTFQERAEAARASLAPNDRQVLLAKIEENASLISSNRVLRDDKKTLEEKLSKKSEELSVSIAQLNPLQEELFKAQREIEYQKAEAETLKQTISTWRTRATTLTTKVHSEQLKKTSDLTVYQHDRIDPEEHEKVKAQLQDALDDLQAAEAKAAQEVSILTANLVHRFINFDKHRKSA